MSNQLLVGRGTKIFVAPLNGGERIAPPDVTFTVATGGADAGDTTIPVTITGLTGTLKAPFAILFKDSTGRESYAAVTTDVDAGDTAITVTALKKAVPATFTAEYPLLLRNRNSANLTDADAQSDVMTFDNNGWRDRLTTMLGNGLDAGGYYSPLDPGYMTCLKARLSMSEIFWRVEYPAPEGYTKGHTVQGFGDVTMPIEDAADGIMTSNITITSRGPVTFIDPT